MLTFKALFANILSTIVRNTQGVLLNHGVLSPLQVRAAREGATMRQGLLPETKSKRFLLSPRNVMRKKNSHD